MTSTTETTRIRWTGNDPSREYAAFTGSAGPSGWNWVPFGIYEEQDGPVAGHRTHFLVSELPGQERRRHFGHPDDLKAEAERWLERFASSLGAAFPEGECPECGFRPPTHAHDKNCSHYREAATAAGEEDR